MTARARQADGSRMNGQESLYAQQLDLARRAGVIRRWDYQPLKLRLADRTYYTPDFRVILPDWTEEFHEVKGFIEDDAMVKIKVAAEQHPYKFVMIRRTKRVFQTIWESPR